MNRLQQTDINIAGIRRGYAHETIWGQWFGDRPLETDLLGYLFYGEWGRTAPFGGRNVKITDNGSFYAIVHTD